MVQAIENWTDVDGTIAAVAPAAAGSDRTVVLLEVDTSVPVDGFPDLLGEVVGSQLEVGVRNEVAVDLDLRIGRRLHARVQKVSPTVVVAHPHHLHCEDA